MTPTWERAPEAPHLEGPLLMDAVLRPHRSLSAGAFKLMVVLMIAVNAAIGLVFWLQGAFPVAGFLGLDVLALWLAFRWNYRAGQAVEYVRVAPGRVHVAAVGKSGAPTHWVLNPVWARVARDGRGVLIRDGEGQMRVGAFLSPKECESFASALSLALSKAKRGT
ncbi:MAG: hypothetical protein A4S17_10750 [Proteobacteria bacterium HN_bin10]|nr:MAG: hypothetical protein A4S17_10750 [Proteobacteria bacterium HN_bin10]